MWCGLGWGDKYAAWRPCWRSIILRLLLWPIFPLRLWIYQKALEPMRIISGLVPHKKKAKLYDCSKWTGLEWKMFFSLSSYCTCDGIYCVRLVCGRLNDKSSDQCLLWFWGYHPPEINKISPTADVYFGDMTFMCMRASLQPEVHGSRRRRPDRDLLFLLFPPSLAHGTGLLRVSWDGAALDPNPYILENQQENAR